MQQINPDFQKSDNAARVIAWVMLGWQFVDLQASYRCLAGQARMHEHTGLGFHSIIQSRWMGSLKGSRLKPFMYGSGL
eukprot:1159344-Pelagomonas_calceolata.AAC.1